MNGHKLVFSILFALAALSTYGTVLLLTQRGSQYWPGMLLAAAFFSVGMVIRRQQREEQRRQDLEAHWGEPVDQKRSFERLRELHELMAPDHLGFVVDQRTWDDLDMDRVFEQLDRCLSSAGQQVLFHQLHCPQAEPVSLERRGAMIHRFEDDAVLREEVRLALDGLNWDEGEGAAFAVWEGLPQGRLPLWAGRLLLGAAIGSLAALFWSLPVGVLGVALVFAINMAVHYREQKFIQGHFDSLKYVSRLVKTGQALAKLIDPDLDPCLQTLRAAAASLKALPRQVGFLGSGRSSGDLQDMLLEYINIFFLLEVRGYQNVRVILQQQNRAAKDFYTALGEIDAAQSAASYRQSLPFYCQPSLGRSQLQMEAAYHPLIKDPVPNSLTVKGRAVLITGSNMSGKSTFLRAVGLNALLGQTIFTCHARQLQSPFFRIVTSIGRADDVIEGKSYYLVEALAVKRILDSLGSGPMVLAVVDELFRGTNSEERLQAAAGVIDYLSRRDCVVFCATHDLNLVERLGSRAENYHFRELLSDDEGLDFDYKLHPGPASTRNALRLLRYLGYPPEVTGG